MLRKFIFFTGLALAGISNTVFGQAEHIKGAKVEIFKEDGSNNGDAVFFHRTDNVTDYANLRLNMGNEVTSKFEIGYYHWDDDLWYQNFYLDGTGNAKFKGSLSSNSLFLQTPASSSETLATFKVSDAPTDYLKIANSTSTQNQFIPMIYGYHDSDPRAGLYLIGATSSARDSGNEPIMAFDSRLAKGPSVNRPLFAWESYGQRRMTMLANGNLGIGTSLPTSKLSLKGTLSIGISDATDKQWGEFMMTKVNHGENYASLGFDTGTQSDAQNNVKEALVIKRKGNIGIGTNTPSAPLEINQRERDKALVISEPDNSVSIQLHLAKNGWGEYGFLALGGDTKLRGNGGVSSFDGTMAIGQTTVPTGYKLAIAGKTIAEEVKVQVKEEWPDYVFKTGYDLPTLSEVERHIEKTGHLRDIPNAGQVKDNGLLLGEINAKLLRKIEELTLYAIEQEKKLDSLSNENKRIKDLELRLSRQEEMIKQLLEASKIN
ncbi:hypothetical protein FUAX_53110 (plasmid) [Fulvitalea axinellae]|uniref:Peptidase S74 domain-containing protein n=1 Tax=Fulvitalea axinellae TaxID=1182444 RepID=A0AAU9D2S2_9BACT|nr:hypothetical protein FUAX_53110 [Fulvitalea axinellae]